MKKSLIALAVLAASGAAMAQSSVSIYGVLDVVMHKDKGANAALTSGGVSTSRLGFKGTEDLGGGLKANFVLEQKIGVDTGAGGTWNRQSYVGLSGGFGEVKFGKMWNAYDDVAGASDAVFGANVLSPLNLVFLSYANYNGNPNNGLYYATPSFGGFSGAVSVGMDEAAGSNDVVAFNAQYAAGPVAVALGYQDEGDAANVKYTTLNGSYDLGVAKLLATYARVNAAVDTTEYALGADIPLASNVVASVGYGRSKTDGMKAATSVSGAVAYVLSKRTTVYAGLASTNDEAVAQRSAPKTRYGFGLKHTF